MLIAESTATGTITVEYAYLNGQPLAKIESNNVYYYHNDHLGTPALMTNSSGTTVWQEEFKPFGEPLTVTGTVTNNLRFPGQYYNSETGLHQNYFRDYKSEMGRYVESDPIGIQKGINHLFVYTSNNPVDFIDPWGLWKFSWGIGGALGMFDINWNTLSPYNTNLDIISPQLGGGVNFCFNFDKPSENDGCDSNGGGPFDDQPLSISVGAGKYVGIASTTAFDRICINVGWAKSTLPFNFGLPVYSYSHE